MWTKIRRILLAIWVSKSKGQVTLPYSEVAGNFLSLRSFQRATDGTSFSSTTRGGEAGRTSRIWLYEWVKNWENYYLESVSSYPQSLWPHYLDQLISRICSKISVKTQSVNLLFIHHTEQMWPFLLNSDCLWVVCVCFYSLIQPTLPWRSVLFYVNSC